MKSKTIAILNFVFIIFLFGIFWSCDQTFEPLQENKEYYFSIYGYLDAAADTQWVRIGPARRGVNESPDPTGIMVTLEHIQTGETISMNDSLFTSRNALNYWTTFDVKNEQTYRITVERDGKSSWVNVNIPKELPTPHVLVNRSVIPGENINTVYISDSIGHLADVQSKWYVLLQPEGDRKQVTYSFYHRNTAKHTTAYYGSLFVEIYPLSEFFEIQDRNAGTDMEVIHQQIFVASAGPEWDDTIPTIDDLEYFLDGTASNVENGLGYVVGIDSKWVPMETCYDGELHIPCPDEEPFWK